MLPENRGGRPSWQKGRGESILRSRGGAVGYPRLGVLPLEDVNHAIDEGPGIHGLAVIGVEGSAVVGVGK